LVVSSLGDPGGERTSVLANRSRATPGAWITLADLASLPSSNPSPGAAAAALPPKEQSCPQI
jgi:hypothetical protein